MGDLLKNKVFKRVVFAIIGIAFGIGYTIGYIRTYDDKNEVKEKTAYDILQETFQEQENLEK